MRRSAWRHSCCSSRRASPESSSSIGSCSEDPDVYSSTRGGVRAGLSRVAGRVAARVAARVGCPAGDRVGCPAGGRVAALTRLRGRRCRSMGKMRPMGRDAGCCSFFLEICFSHTHLSPICHTPILPTYQRIFCVPSFAGCCSRRLAALHLLLGCCPLLRRSIEMRWRMHTPIEALLLNCSPLSNSSSVEDSE